MPIAIALYAVIYPVFGSPLGNDINIRIEDSIDIQDNDIQDNDIIGINATFLYPISD
ncbi:hypothetical protein HK099_008083 [Clydaea vesicula]|uniref:Uncharacterized protein n=1 Tax=Clydaea vesicula TaxID=447962 RepID=A0AAD5XY39_9FUNG|nr:hypothetical protein HK099_008083 [Clydaea vesicula]